MSQTKISEWPKPDMETLDREIGKRLQRIAGGNATAQEVSEASGLIRERADFMMPGIFQRTRARREPAKV